MNTLIDNLLNFNTTNENNKATNMTVEHTGPSSVSIEKTIPSLYQGDRFIKYQDKIKKNVEKNLGNNG